MTWRFFRRRRIGALRELSAPFLCLTSLKADQQAERRNFSLNSSVAFEKEGDHLLSTGSSSEIRSCVERRGKVGERERREGNWEPVFFPGRRRFCRSDWPLESDRGNFGTQPS
uniref:Putative secreted protein n=1 Tax=Ixodes ricinus TaxID=34613 RepID=A0A6B0UK40_IXORI